MKRWNKRADKSRCRGKRKNSDTQTPPCARRPWPPPRACWRQDTTAARHRRCMLGGRNRPCCYVLPRQQPPRCLLVGKDLPCCCVLVRRHLPLLARQRRPPLFLRACAPVACASSLRARGGSLFTACSPATASPVVACSCGDSLPAACSEKTVSPCVLARWQPPPLLAHWWRPPLLCARWRQTLSSQASSVRCSFSLRSQREKQRDCVVQSDSWTDKIRAGLKG